MSTQSAINVAEAGASPVATFSQTQGGITVYIQQASLVDATSGASVAVDANGLHIVPSIGTPNTSGLLSALAIASGANATMASTVPITSGKTGTLQHGIFSSTQPTLWTLQSVNNAGTPLSVVSFLTDANAVFDFKPGSIAEVSTVLASSAICIFQVIAQNLSVNTSVTANAYATLFWVEN